jgi:hypothetical protein
MRGRLLERFRWKDDSSIEFLESLFKIWLEFVRNAIVVTGLAFFAAKSDSILLKLFAGVTGLVLLGQVLIHFLRVWAFIAKEEAFKEPFTSVFAIMIMLMVMSALLLLMLFSELLEALKVMVAH